MSVCVLLGYCARTTSEKSYRSYAYRNASSSTVYTFCIHRPTCHTCYKCWMWGWHTSRREERFNTNTSCGITTSWWFSNDAIDFLRTMHIAHSNSFQCLCKYTCWERQDYSCIHDIFILHRPLFFYRTTFFPIFFVGAERKRRKNVKDLKWSTTID